MRFLLSAFLVVVSSLLFAHPEFVKETPLLSELDVRVISDKGVAKDSCDGKKKSFYSYFVKYGSDFSYLFDLAYYEFEPIRIKGRFSYHNDDLYSYSELAEYFDVDKEDYSQASLERRYCDSLREIDEADYNYCYGRWRSENGDYLILEGDGTIWAEGGDYSLSGRLTTADGCVLEFSDQTIIKFAEESDRLRERLPLSP